MDEGLVVLCVFFLAILGMVYVSNWISTISTTMAPTSRGKVPGPVGPRVRSKVIQPPAGTQMGYEQIDEIKRVLGQSGNLLVWGLGNDSPFWHDVTTGRTVFIEDDIPQAKAGTLWYDIIMKRYPFLEAYKVHYSTNCTTSYDKYMGHPELWPELRLSDLPDSIRSEKWHVIIVDAPLGHLGFGPGRYQSIYETLGLVKNKTHVFVDDYNRKVEYNFSRAVFGMEPDRVISRYRNRNQQAHFVLDEEQIQKTGNVQKKACF